MRGKLQQRYDTVRKENRANKASLLSADAKWQALEKQFEELSTESSAQISDLAEKLRKAEEHNASLKAELGTLSRLSTACEEELRREAKTLRVENESLKSEHAQEHQARLDSDSQLRTAEQRVKNIFDVLEGSMKKVSEKNVDSLVRQFIADLRREKAQKGTQTLADPLDILREYNLGSMRELLAAACEHDAGLYVSAQTLKRLDLVTISKLLQNDPRVRDSAFSRANAVLQQVLQQANDLGNKRRSFNKRNFIISPRYDAKLWSRQSRLEAQQTSCGEPLPKISPRAT